MGSSKYEIIVEKMGKVAECYDLPVATAIVEGLFEKYYNEKDLSITIRRIREEGEAKYE